MTLLYKDWAKQFYLSTRNYPDTVGITQSKEIWNHVLDKFPRLSEFWSGTHDLRELTSLERSFLEYIIQSELQKPYRNPYYPEMEYTWPRWEFPYPECDDVSPDCDPGGPDIWIFDAESPSCFCPGAVRPFVITGTYPIYYLTITETDCPGYGTGVAIAGGWGTNRLYGSIKACASEEGFITIEASMNAPDGTPGDSNVNIFECSDCCAEITCDPSNPETVGIYGSGTLSWLGGSGLFNISISGTGFWLDSGHSVVSMTDYALRYKTIYTDASACGPGSLTITDADPSCPGVSVTCNIRCTNGKWTYTNPCCDCCGDGYGTVVGSVIQNYDDPICRQTDRYTFSAQCTSGACGCTDHLTWCGTVDLCLLPDSGMFTEYCIPASEASISGNLGLNCYGGAQRVSCFTECSPPNGSFDKSVRCLAHLAGYPQCGKWECP